jgi:ankyrin repeat protein
MFNLGTALMRPLPYAKSRFLEETLLLPATEETGMPKAPHEHALEMIDQMRESKKISRFALPYIGLPVGLKEMSPLMAACFLNKPMFLELFLKSCPSSTKASLLASKSSSGFSVIHYAVGNSESEDSTACLEILLEHGATHYELSSYGTPLMQAIRVGKIHVFDFLLAKGKEDLKSSSYRDLLWQLVEGYGETEMKLHLMKAIEELL